MFSRIETQLLKTVTSFWYLTMIIFPLCKNYNDIIISKGQEECKKTIIDKRVLPTVPSEKMVKRSQNKAICNRALPTLPIVTREETSLSKTVGRIIW